MLYTFNSNTNLSQNMTDPSSVILPIDCRNSTIARKSTCSPLHVTYMGMIPLKGKVHLHVINIYQKGAKMHKDTQQ